MNKLKLNKGEEIIELGCLIEEQKVIAKWEEITGSTVRTIDAIYSYPRKLAIGFGIISNGRGGIKASEWLARFEDQSIEPVNSHPFATYELVNYDSPEGTCLIQGSFAKCKEEMRPGNILRPLDKSKFLPYNEGELVNMRKKAQTASMGELRTMVRQCLDALSE
jgi:hypothetical protein